MDLNAIKSKLSSLNGSDKGGKKEKKDYTLIYWKPKNEGKYKIRFVPSKINKSNPFQEVKMHYNIGKYPIVALTNWGEKDPIVEFVSKLFKQEDKESWDMAKKLSPKMRIFAPIIVRGEEDKGVRLFEFSKTLYLELLSIADDEDYGDFTDINEGFDMTLTASKVDGRMGYNLSIRPARKSSPLSDDENEINTWLEDQPELLKERFKYTYDNLKEELQNYLTGGNEDEVTEVEEEEDDTVEFVDPKPQSSNPPKKSTKTKFDDVFEEDEELNDLPWEKKEN